VEGRVSPCGKGLEGASTHFAVIYERIFTQIFKLIKIYLKMSLFSKKYKLQNSPSARASLQNPYGLQVVATFPLEFLPNLLLQLYQQISL